MRRFQAHVEDDSDSYDDQGRQQTLVRYPNDDESFWGPRDSENPDDATTHKTRTEENNHRQSNQPTQPKTDGGRHAIRSDDIRSAIQADLPPRGDEWPPSADDFPPVEDDGLDSPVPVLHQRGFSVGQEGITPDPSRSRSTVSFGLCPSNCSCSGCSADDLPSAPSFGPPSGPPPTIPPPPSSPPPSPSHSRNPRPHWLTAALNRIYPPPTAFSPPIIPSTSAWDHELSLAATHFLTSYIRLLLSFTDNAWITSRTACRLRPDLPCRSPHHQDHKLQAEREFVSRAWRMLNSGYLVLPDMVERVIVVTAVARGRVKERRGDWEGEVEEWEVEGTMRGLAGGWEPKEVIRGLSRGLLGAVAWDVVLGGCEVGREAGSLGLRGGRGRWEGEVTGESLEQLSRALEGWVGVLWGEE